MLCQKKQILFIKELVLFSPWLIHSPCIPLSLPVSSHTFPSALFSFSTYLSVFLLLLSYTQQIWTIPLLPSRYPIRHTFLNFFFPLISLFLHPQSFPTKNSYFSKNHVLLHCKPILPNTMCFYTARIFLPSLLFLWTVVLITKCLESIIHVHCFYLNVIYILSP